MPTPEQILSGLTDIANEWRLLAVVWHVYLGAVAAALLLGRRPSRRVAGMLLALPLLSVSILAWVAGNPFNGSLFAVAGAAAMTLAAGMSEGRVRPGPTWAVVSGTLLFCFGWMYPHFLETSYFLAYLYAAPVGLVPCPTLSAITGLGLILGGLNSRAWSLLIGGMGAFYGVFGAARLGVAIDGVLVGGALLLGSYGFVAGRRTAPAP